MEPKRTYYKNGQIETEEWRNEAGKRHRLDGPAWQAWCTNGQLGVECWYVDGRRHRLDGPAHRKWGKNGRVFIKQWYINDVQYKTEAEFQIAVDLYKANEIADLF